MNEEDILSLARRIIRRKYNRDPKLVVGLIVPIKPDDTADAVMWCAAHSKSGWNFTASKIDGECGIVFCDRSDAVMFKMFNAEMCL